MFRVLASSSAFSAVPHNNRGFRSLSSTRVALKARGKLGPERVGNFWEARMDAHVWRPTINDVERISWGKPAKKKGTGSRGVPHRLNLDERFLFDTARRRGYLEIEGSGWRSQRREAPLLNTYRSLCDARGQASIVLHKGNTGIDELVVDISPLRNPPIFDRVAEVCLEQRPGGEVAFQSSETMEETLTVSSDDDSDEIESLPITLSIVRDSDVGMAGDTGGGELTPWESRPIYHLPPHCVSWELPRGEAKTLAKTLATLFDTKEERPAGASSRKPVGVKPGKGRRHGGYGIG